MLRPILSITLSAIALALALSNAACGRVDAASEQKAESHTLTPDGEGSWMVNRNGVTITVDFLYDQDGCKVYAVYYASNQHIYSNCPETTLGDAFTPQ